MRIIHRIASILWAAAIGAAALAAGASPARAARVDSHLEKAARGRPEMVDIIVQTEGRPTFKHRALIAAFGGEAGLPFSTIDGFAARVPSPALNGLAHNPHFTILSADAPVDALWDRNAVRPPVGVPEAYATYGVTGAGVGVAVIDSGAANHEDLGNGTNTAVRGFIDFLSTTGKTLIDPYGHGSHVAGIISGRGSATRQFAGVAPGASLYVLRVLDGNGRGSVSRVLQALDWVMKNATVYNIRVVNLSIGHPVFESSTTDPLCLAVKALAERGIVVVAAAGNFGQCDGSDCYGGITVPGNSPYVITVGAMNPRGTTTRVDDVIARFSSRGPTLIDGLTKPDVVANGAFSVSLSSSGSYFDTNYHDLWVSSFDYGSAIGADDYFVLSGTSMAAPVVSGIAALMLQKNPALTPNLVKAILMFTAEDRGYDTMTQGAGYVNAPGAVEAASKITTDVASYADGQYWLKAPLSGQSSIDGQYILWTGILTLDSMLVKSTSAQPIIGYKFEDLWGQGVLWNSLSFSFAQGFEDLGVESSSVLWSGSVASFSVLWGTYLNFSAADLVFDEGLHWQGKK